MVEGCKEERYERRNPTYANGANFRHYMECKLYLEDLIGCKVDLVMQMAIKKQLKPEILSEIMLQIIHYRSSDQQAKIQLKNNMSRTGTGNKLLANLKG